MQKHLWSMLCLLVMIALAAGSVDSGSGSVGSSPAGSSSTSSAPSKIEAWVMAKQFVEDSLKAPGSASFGGVFGDYQDPNEVVTDLGGGKYRVKAWVDAQNSFGANLRTHFVCELQHVGGDRWRCTSLQFLE